MLRKNINHIQKVTYNCLLLILVVFFLPLSSASDLLGLPVNINNNDDSPLFSGNIVAEIWDSLSGGTLIYNSTTDFYNYISNGTADLLLGSRTQKLNLNYSQIYYLVLYVNNQKFSFNGSSRQQFQSPIGNITEVNYSSIKNVPDFVLPNSENRTKSNIANISGINWANVVTSTNPVGIIASIANNVLTLIVQNYFNQQLNTTSSPTFADMILTGTLTVQRILVNEWVNVTTYTNTTVLVVENTINASSYCDNTGCYTLSQLNSTTNDTYISLNNATANTNWTNIMFNLWSGYISNWYNHTLSVWNEWGKYLRNQSIDAQIYGNNTYRLNSTGIWNLTYEQNLDTDTFRDNYTKTINITVNNSILFNSYTLAVINQSFNKTYENYNKNVSTNWTALAITQGDGRYWNITLGSKNATYDLYATNVSLNETARAITIGDLRYWNITLGTANVSLDRALINTSINWTAIYNWTLAYNWSIPIGIWINVSIQQMTSNASSTYNSTYHSAYLNGTVNQTANAITQTLAISSYNLSINWTDRTMKIGNITYAIAGAENQTKPHCSNITGAVSDLCTITGGGAETDPIWQGNQSIVLGNITRYDLFYRTNQSINWTALAITEGKNLFALLSENATLWIEAKNKYNSSYETCLNNASYLSTYNSTYQAINTTANIVRLLNGYLNQTNNSYVSTQNTSLVLKTTETFPLNWSSGVMNYTGNWNVTKTMNASIWGFGFGTYIQQIALRIVRLFAGSLVIDDNLNVTGYINVTGNLNTYKINTSRIDIKNAMAQTNSSITSNGTCTFIFGMRGNITIC